ncbi:hypothetical protein [Helicobacter brantae]|uniref:Uncharacterized protein n=1 Tax=Helicobacter brantae TaxID=375927 RepID=A0A3D8IWC1_9HELI|nr:hypothetical protein [Helicobacter brantae]RDU68871.1 hypothetical protein CQA58_07810 [Helicobacter brantae]
MSETIKATIKTKDGTRSFALPLKVMSAKTQEVLRGFFEKKEQVSIEEVLSFLISQSESNTKNLEKFFRLQEENSKLKDNLKEQENKLEQLYKKLETL